MYQVGITGGIGTGKSTVATIFKVLGIAVFNADEQAKIIMNTNTELKENICAEFGNESYTNNELNTKYIANLVFNDSNKLEKLNAIVHPITIATYNNWVQHQTSKYVVKEAALMFEAGANKNIDFIIGIFAPLEIRYKRLWQRDNLTQVQVDARIAKQMSDDEKMKLCNTVIINDEKDLILPQVLQIHQNILQLLDK